MNNFKRVLVFALIILFVILGFVFVQQKINLYVDNNTVVNNDNNANDENQLEELEQEENTIEEDEPPVEETNKEEQVNEPPQQSNKNNTTTNNKTQNNSNNKPTTNNNSSVTEKPKKEEVTTPPVIKKEIWDELGITEYEYYHSPMISGQKVTHSDMKSCQTEGDSKINNSSSGYSQYWCMEVNSYSGDRLGYMLQLS